MRRRPLVGTVIPVLTAAVLGNAFVPQTSRRWFRGLRQPKLAIPFPAFVTIAVAGDRISTSALAPYTIWVLAYDIPWSYRLWRLNP